MSDGNTKATETPDSAASALSAGLGALLASLQARADNAYCDYIGLCRRDECLGWEAKTEKGIFGDAELKAHKDAAEKLGRHRALQEAANALHALMAAAAEQRERIPADEQLRRIFTELEPTQEEADAARYNWLVGKVFARGETCLTILEEFGGARFNGETMREFMDRYIDAAILKTANV